MSDDYRGRIGANKGRKDEQRFYDFKIVNGQPTIKDRFIKNLDSVFDSIDIIINNSNYQLHDLKKMYVIDFYKVLNKIEKKLKDVRRSS